LVKTNVVRRIGIGLAAVFTALALAASIDIPAAQAQQGDAVAPAGARPSKPAARARTTQSTSRRNPAQRSSGRYYIEFRSRYALSYGHTFTAFGRLNARGEIATQEVAGLHPAGEGAELWTVGHLVPVPSETGPSDGDLEEEYISARYRVELNEAEYKRVVAYIRQHQADSPLWHAALYNCNAWTGDVARFMGLKTPFHWLPPQDYVNGIRDLNGSQPAMAAPGQPAMAAPAAYSSAGETRDLAR
jgi:hypothetical protein